MTTNNQPITRTELHQLRALLLNQKSDILFKVNRTFDREELDILYKNYLFIASQIRAIESRLNQWYSFMYQSYFSSFH